MNPKFRIKLRPAINAIYIDMIWMLFTSGGFYKRPATSTEASELDSLDTGDTDLFGRRLVTLTNNQQHV